jgi:hypothetical protein
MSKKVVLPLTLLFLATCILSYKLRSVPAALAKGRPAQQDLAERVPPPLSAPPAEWSISSAPGSGGAASVTRAYGGTGVQHVADCIIATTYYQPGNGTSAGPSNQVYLLDIPASGGQTYLGIWNIATPNSLYGMSTISICGLSIVGSSNAEMKLAFSNSGTDIVQSVTLVGHDAT